jgi:hypothetical protein
MPLPTVLIALLLSATPTDKATDTVAVCPAEFRQALAPWLEHRRAQGHRVAVISAAKSAVQIRSEVRRIAAGGRLHYLLLVGDADPAMAHSAAVRKICVPTHHARAVVNVQFGSEPQIATDNWYADLDDDRVPELAVGRLTCDSPAELEQMVRKILDYENSADFGLWRRQIHFVAGLGGFGPVADAVLEGAAKALIGQGIPSSYSTTMTYGSWQSPYCPDPQQFQRVTMERLNEGSLFWVYLGHGQQRAVDEVHVPGARYPILSSSDAGQLACRHGAPIACLLACYSGAFDQPRDCLAEDMLRNPGGPVAVLCGSRVTMPYGMTVLGSELLRQCFVEGAETLGDAVLAAKRRTMATENLSGQRQALDAVAKALSPTAGELEAERAEHLELFNLLGDPLLRIPYPNPLKVAAPASAAPGQTISISGNSPLAGVLMTELSVRRDRLTFQPPRRERFDARELDTYAEVYRRANDPRWTAGETKLPAGPFATRLAIPLEAHGLCHVRVFIEGADGCAAGAADVRIEGPVPPSKANRPAETQLR